MATILNAVSGTGLTQTADASGVLKVQSNGVTTNALAWVNFNGSAASPTAATIRSSYNVSSVSHAAAGVFTLNFTSALADANYLVVTGCDNTTSNSNVVLKDSATAATTTTYTLKVFNANTGGAIDPTYVACAVFGN